MFKMNDEQKEMMEKWFKQGSKYIDIDSFYNITMVVQSPFDITVVDRGSGRIYSEYERMVTNEKNVHRGENLYSN